MDLRKPTSYFFLITGVTLIGTDLLWKNSRAALAPPHVNLYAGVAMFLFASVLGWLANRHS